MIEETIIREIVERLVKKFHPVKIVLFGSQARSDTHLHSDVDLLVVVDEADRNRAILVEMHRALQGLGVSKDIVTATRQEVERFRDVKGTVIYQSLHQGKTLYERTA